MERKVFLKLLLASAVTGSAITFLEACKKEDLSPRGPSADFTLDISHPENSSLQDTGGYLIHDQVMVINNNGSFIALSDVCTHEDCALGYDNGQKRLSCSCHGSMFNTDGSVINGPAKAPLKQYTITQNGNTIHVQG